ncbi:tetratricopeptide repeat protein [Kutzneria sp. NPDC052558]|uniref:tetratricopeptide repeat protein n=1 Tax=Kutzneria sp. NPDC052558 TaxID=3364121 RepID=UPI0037C6F51F
MDGDRVDGDRVRNDFRGIADTLVQADRVRDIYFEATEPGLPKVVPALVPAPPAPFTNRFGELARVRALLDGPRDGRTRPVVVVVRGTPGVGKSALLRQVATVLRKDFPDGALHVSYGVGDASPAQAASRFLVALGVPEKAVPVAYEHRADLFRSLTADGRIIAVFDDVTEAAQVTPLLPNSPNSLVLVAGARADALEELYVDGAVDVRLEPLTTEHAIELLEAVFSDGRVAADPVAAAELVEVCGHLPLALRVAASWLARRPQWGVRRLVEHLSEVDYDPNSVGRSARDKVYSVFDLAYEALPASTRSLYRLLGVTVGVHFGPAVLAAMSGRPLAGIRADLDTLTQADLVEDLGGDVFRLHRLVRVHALRRAAAEDSDADRVLALRRAADWWLDAASVADMVATGPGRLRAWPPSDQVIATAATLPKTAGVAWLNQELPNLLAVMRAAAKQGWHDVVWRTFEAMWPLLDARHPHDAWLEAGQLAVTSAQLSGNKLGEVRCRCQLAKGYQERGWYDRAHAELDRAPALAPGGDEGRFLASTLDFRGNVLLRQGRAGEALDCFRTALEINERLGPVRAVALMSLLVGRALTALGRYDEAMAAFERSRVMIEGSDFESLLPKLLVSRAKALSAKGDDVEAERTLLLAVDRAGPTVPAADALAELSALAERRGDRDAVRDYLDQAVELYKSMGITPRAAEVLAARPTK